MNYRLDQVKPIINRLLATLPSARIPLMELVAEARDSGKRAVSLTEEGKDGKPSYELRIFRSGVSLLRDGEEIHNSRVIVTNVSRYL